MVVSALASSEQLARLPDTYIEADEFDALRMSGRVYAEQIAAAGGFGGVRGAMPVRLTAT